MDHHFYELNIKELRRETPDAVSLVFEKHPAFAEYLAGQFLTLKMKLGGEEIRRAYSLCSSPLAGESPTVTVKKVDGGKMSTFLVDQLSEGQKLEVMPPIGNFVFRPHLTKKRWFMLFAAGSGITPLFSILKTVLLSEPQSYVSLLFGSRNESSILYHKELEEWVRRYPSRLKVVHTLSQPSSDWFGETGRIDEPCIMQHLEYLKPVSPFDETCVYMCGPQAMMDEVTKIVHTQGVTRDHIFRESFTSGIDEATKQAVAETLEIKDRQVEIRLNGKTHPGCST
jgi:ring-1,2-phenylacetyl-CoA epoxidase subunit PaaE